MTYSNKKTHCLFTATLVSLALVSGCSSQAEIPLVASVDLALEEASEVAAEEVSTARAVPAEPFLDTVMGHWKGNCELIYPGYPYSVRDVEMERIVAPTEDPDRYTWQIIYRTPESEQLRDYSLVVVNRDRGHYQVDENNGIIIDLYYYTPGILTQIFDIANVRIIGHETFNGDQLELQLITTLLEPATTSQAGPYIVNSYPFRGNQKCSLERIDQDDDSDSDSD